MGDTPFSIHGAMIIIAVLLVLGSPPVLTAASNDTAASASSGKNFDFDADKIVINKTENSVEGIGNAIIRLGETVITADDIKTFFKKSADGGLSLKADSTGKIEDSVEKIVASDNVKIVFEELVATGNEGVYESAGGSLTLTGDPATILNGADTTSSTEISAERIVFDRAEVSTEFIGNVTVTHEETVITADKVKAFFKKSADGGFALNEGSAENIGDSVEKMVASGSVKIDLEGDVGTGDEAVYDSNKGSFVLTGDPATIVASGLTASAPEVEMIGNL